MRGKYYRRHRRNIRRIFERVCMLISYTHAPCLRRSLALASNVPSFSLLYLSRFFRRVGACTSAFFRICIQRGEGKMYTKNFSGAYRGCARIYVHICIYLYITFEARVRARKLLEPVSRFYCECSSARGECVNLNLVCHQCANGY